MAVALPVGWSQQEFDDFVATLEAGAAVESDDRFYSRVPDYLQAHAYAWYNSETIPTLPTGWSSQEFEDYMGELFGAANDAYYRYILARTPSYLQDNVLAAGAAGGYDFTTGALPALTTYTRAGNAWGFNSAGVLTQRAANVPVFDYDPTTLEIRGLLVEPTATSPTATTPVGTVTGSPGTNPTNMFLTAAANALTRTIHGVGTTDGIDWVEVSYVGTPSASGSFAFWGQATSTTGLAAVQGDVVSGSCFVRLADGSSLTGISLSRLLLSEMSSGGGGLGGTAFAYSPTVAPLRTQRVAHTQTNGNAATAFMLPNFTFSYTLNVPINMRFQVGFMNVYKAPSSTSPIKNAVGTASPVTRSAPVVTIRGQSGYRDVEVVRQSGTTYMAGVDLTGGEFVVPVDPSPLRQVIVRY